MDCRTFKGGNLCAYAILNIDEKYLDNIQMAYDLDGPGFKNDVFNIEAFENRKTNYWK